MKPFATRKKFRLQPYLFGLPLKIAYVYFGVTGFIVLIILFLTLFDINIFILIGIGLVLSYACHLICSFIGERNVEKLQKRFFSKKVRVIKNNTIKPFKINDTDH